MTIDQLATFFGWCTVINVGLILLIVLFTAMANKEGFPFGVAARIFGVTKEDVRITHLRVIQQYRLAVVTLNIIPYIALKIMM
jgi:hypothetical protein